MPACVTDTRIEQIARCADELSNCVRSRQKPGWPAGEKVLHDIWELDWLSELHRLLYD